MYSLATKEIDSIGAELEHALDGGENENPVLKSVAPPLYDGSREAPVSVGVDSVSLLGDQIIFSEIARSFDTVDANIEASHQYHSFIEDGLIERQRMIEDNLPLVASIAKRYPRNALVSVKDHIQIGSIGLMRAVDRFDRRKGVSFGHYAYFWIRQAISNNILREGKALRFPAHVDTRNKELFRLATLKEQEDARIEKRPFVDSHVEIPSGLRLQQNLQNPLMIDRSTSDSERNLHEVIADSTPSTEEIVERNSRVKDIFNLAKSAQVSGRELLILKAGMGFFENELGPKGSIEKMGEQLGIKRARAQQLYSSAILKIKVQDALLDHHESCQLQVDGQIDEIKDIRDIITLNREKGTVLNSGKKPDEALGIMNIFDLMYSTDSVLNAIDSVSENPEEKSFLSYVFIEEEKQKKMNDLFIKKHGLTKAKASSLMLETVRALKHER